MNADTTNLRSDHEIFDSFVLEDSNGRVTVEPASRPAGRHSPRWFAFDLVSPAGDVVGNGTVLALDAHQAVHSARLTLAGLNDVVLSGPVD